MNVLFLTYANSQAAPLDSLKAEDDAVYRALAPRALKQHYLLHRDSFVSIAQVAEYLTLYRDHLTLFHYSGHANRDTLVLEEERAQAEGIAHLMGQCKQLQLVVLNGCSTRGQVEALLTQGVPVVIATSAPVADQKAARFAIRFYDALAQSATILQAYELAKGEVLTMDAALEEELGRGLAFPNEEGAVWGLYYREAHAGVLQTTLPARSAQPVTQEYTPNKRLIEALWEGLGKYSEQIQLLSGRKTSQSRKRMAILNSLPAPVAEHLRRLIVPVEEENKGWDKISLERLKQVTLVYQTVMELMAFTLIAQLWEIALKQGALSIAEERQQEILSFLRLKQEEQQAYDYLRFIRHLRGLIDEAGGEYFIEELKTIKDLLYQKGDFQTACFFLEVLRVKVHQQTVATAELPDLCMRAEESLAAMLGVLGFMAKYALVAIQDIDVLKFRHEPKANFNHIVVVLRDLLGGMEVTELEMKQFMDNRSVILFNEETKAFMSLSPFLIDANSFKKNTNVVKIYFLSHYEPQEDAYCFKYINRPEDPLTDIRVTQHDFGIVKVQLQAFINLIAPAL
jgi:hypothetical protein